jgi:type I restriction enzyme, S subunit
MPTLPRVPLREAAEPIARAVAPAVGEVYRQLGVRLWGQGAYEREPVDGNLTKYQQLFRAEQGDIVVNKIWARNGSVAVVDEELSGCHGSNEFPMFSPMRGRLDPRWMHWITKSPDFWAQCDQKSQGTSGQNRIKPERFLDVEIPLPLLHEQRRIVIRIEELVAKVNEAQRLRIVAAAELDAQWPATLNRAFEGTLVSPVAFAVHAQELLEQSAKRHSGFLESKHNNAYPHKPRKHDDGPHALPRGWCWTTLGSVLTHMVDCVNDTPNFSEIETGLIGLKTTNIRPYRLDLQRRWHMTPEDFASWNRRQAPQAGDIVLTREAPVGHVCMIPAEISVCLTQRLMLIRVEKHVVLPRYLLHFLNSPCFGDQVASSGRGQTHKHIRVGDAPHFLLPLPPMEQQATIVTALDELQAKHDAVKALQAKTATELDSMFAAILDKAFKGEL